MVSLSRDLESSTVQTLAGDPVTLPCPGLGQSPFVVSLTWLCRRCGPSVGADGSPHKLIVYRDGRVQPAAAAAAAPAAAGGRSGASERGAETRPYAGLGDRTAEEVTPDKPRLRLDETTYALLIDATRASDTGDYFCLVNSRQQPKGAVRLEVKVLHYLIHVRETERGPWDRSLRTASNRTMYQVTGLRPFTVYSFRLTAVNAVGAGRPGPSSYPVNTLREAPSGTVGDLRAVSRGPTSVQLSWMQADPSTLHGEFLGYQLTYRAPATGANHTLVIMEQNVTTLVVTGLEPFTEYLFSLSIRNPRGLGPVARVTGRTQQAAPGPPATVRYSSVGSTWAALIWTPPAERNGVLLCYTVNITRDAGGEPDLRRVPATEETWVQYRVDGLRPYTQYTVGVSAATEVGSGRQRLVRLRTDTSAPGRPVILSITCVHSGATQVRWRGPTESGPPPVSFFTIGYRNARHPKYTLTGTPAGVGEHTILMRHLDPGMTYFKIQAVRRSRYSQSDVYRGEFTEPWSVLLPRRNSDCSEFRLIRPVQDDSSLAIGIGVLAGVVVVSVLVAGIVIFLCRRRSRRGRPPLVAKAAQPDWRQEAIPAHMFAGYVMDLQRGADAGFWKEMAAVDGAAEKSGGVAVEYGTGPPGEWPAPLAGCQVQQRSDSTGGLLLLPPPSPAHRITSTLCACCAGRSRQEVRYVLLDTSSPAGGVRQYLLRQAAATRPDTHPTVLVVTRGAEQEAALLVAADILNRQRLATGDLSPVAVLARLRAVRPRWFTEVAQLKVLYQLISESLRTDEHYGN
ncbi:Receptor-type tyrosine-protein phosphatase delta [Amphibalanus amphitrite]|uniref:Receptor-type tyrosine-protein phosphatase delta n=1 Tax=Amphibalanus amphitrite TaxID=1232801 RepID=A0A6A4V9C2_AMPAM|nr:Receptor-type tyrosine-protein phosphatase delta [Amphibalanus amphitrite]